MSRLSYALIRNFPEEYKLFSNTKFKWKDKVYKTHNKLMLNYDGADGIKTGYIKASGFQLAFSAVRQNKRLIGIYFGGDTGKQRNSRLKIYMDNGFKKLKIDNEIKIESKNNNLKLQIKNKSYSIVVGTFKYRKNALKQIELIKSKYPKTTKDKESQVVFIEVSGKKLYESRFDDFTKKDAYQACKRLKKYGRDCFVRL
jgi:D-alanyl-D-alanine carboxypeptidase